MADLTAEEISRLVMATPPRAFDAQQFQPVVAPPDSQPDPNMPPIQAAAAQPVSVESPSFTVNPNYATSNQTFLPEKPVAAPAAPPVAIALPQPAQAQQRQFTPVSLPGSAPTPLANTIMALPPKPFDGQKFQPVIAPPVAPDKSDDPMGDKTEKDQAELARLQKSGSGISQIFHPVDSDGDPDLSKHPGFFRKLGGVAARVGDVAGSMFFPGAMSLIPGTTLHHQVDLNQQTGIVGQDLAQQKAQQDLDTQTQTDEIAAQNATKVPVTNPVTGQTYFVPQKDAAKLLGSVVTAQGRIKSGSDRAEEKLAEAGLKHDDETGDIVPVDADKLPPKLKADAAYKQVHEDLMVSQKALADAKTDVAKAQNDPNSPLYQMKLRALASAERNSGAAQMRATAYYGRYMQSAYNTGLHGEVLAGSPVISADNGAQVVVGTANAGSAGKNQSGAAQFNDVHGSLDALETSAKALVASGQKLNTGFLVAALAEPHSSFQQWFQGAAVKANLSPEERSVVQNIVAARENIQGLRKSAGGIATDAAVNNLLQMLPNGSTPDLGYFLGQTEQIRATATRIGKGATVSTGGLSVRGQGTANQAVPTPATRTLRTGSRQPSAQPNAAPASSGLTVSLSAARNLPQNKGKTDDAIRQDIQAHGHTVGN